jgi:hypothetical protein
MVGFCDSEAGALMPRSSADRAGEERKKKVKTRTMDFLSVILRSFYSMKNEWLSL